MRCSSSSVSSSVLKKHAVRIAPWTFSIQITPASFMQTATVIAFPAGRRAPLPSPAVPARHADLHPGGGPGLGTQGGRWWPVRERPCLGAVDVWAAKDQAGREHETSEGGHEQRQSSLHGVPPFLTSWDDVGYAHSCVWGGMLCIARCVLLILSAWDEGLTVHIRIDACDQPFQRYLRLSYEHRVPEVIRK